MEKDVEGLERELRRVALTISELNRVLGRYKAMKSYIARTKYLKLLLEEVSGDITEIEARIQNVIDKLESKVIEYTKKKESLAKEIKKIKGIIS